MFDTNVSQVKFADWTLCTRSCSLVSEITTQELTPLSYKILCYFILNPNRIISRDEFVSSVWANHYVDDNAINKAISDLRRLLKATNDSPNLIKTHYKKGYSFICEVEYVYEDSTPLGDYSIDATSQTSNEINISATANETKTLNSLTQSSQFLLGYKEKTTSIFLLKYFLLIIALLIAGGGATYWWQTQPKVLNLQSKKLSISDNSVYALLSLSPSNDKLAVSKLNTKNSVDEIFLIDLETHKNTKIISEELDSYPIGWASNSNSIYYQIINNEQSLCEVWRADFRVNNEVAAKEKILDCESQYILSLVTDELSNRIIYTKFGYRNVPSLSALVARDLETGEEFQVTSPNIDSFGDRFVVLAPTKDKIAFIRYQTGLRQIYIANTDGSMQKFIYESTGSIGRINWSKDGSKISWYVPGQNKLMSIDMNKEEITSVFISTQEYIRLMVSAGDTFIATTRAFDDDIFVFEPQLNKLNKITNSKSREFLPIEAKDGFYFFKEGENLWLNSSFGENIASKSLKADLKTINAGTYNEENHTLAISNNNQLFLVEPNSNSVVDSYSFDKQIVNLSWLNENRYLLILEGNQSEQHVWTFDFRSKKLQKIIHKDSKYVSKISPSQVIYQDYFNNLFVFDMQDGTERKLLSLSKYPFVRWRYHSNNIYFTNGENLISYSLETHKETIVLGKIDTDEKIILDFSLLEENENLKFILQIQSIKSNDVVLLEASE